MEVAAVGELQPLRVAVERRRRRRPTPQEGPQTLADVVRQETVEQRIGRRIGVSQQQRERRHLPKKKRKR